MIKEYKMIDQSIENARYNLDMAIDAWLKIQGLTQEQIDDLDYSFIDNELYDLMNSAIVTQ